VYEDDKHEGGRGGSCGMGRVSLDLMEGYSYMIDEDSQGFLRQKLYSLNEIQISVILAITANISPLKP